MRVAVGGATPWPMFSSCREGLQPDMISYKSSAFAFAQVPPNGPEGMLEKTAGVYEDMKIWRVKKIFIHPKKKRAWFETNSQGCWKLMVGQSDSRTGATC